MKTTNLNDWHIIINIISISINSIIIMQSHMSATHEGELLAIQNAVSALLVWAT